MKRKPAIVFLTLMTALCLGLVLALPGLPPAARAEEVHTVTLLKPDGHVLVKVKVPDGLTLGAAFSRNPDAFQPLSSLGLKPMDGREFLHWCLDGGNPGAAYPLNKAITGDLRLKAVFAREEAKAEPEPEAGEPAPENPKAEEPAPEKAKVKPAPEKTKAEEPAPEKAKEKPAPEQPKDGEPAPEQPKAGETAPEKPKAEGPAPDQPKTEKPVPEKPRDEEPKSEALVIEAPKDEEGRGRAQLHRGAQEYRQHHADGHHHQR